MTNPMYHAVLYLTSVAPGCTVRCEGCGAWVKNETKRSMRHDCPAALTPTAPSPEERANG